MNMKYVYLVFTFLVCNNLMLFAQKTISNVSITYELKMDKDNPAASMLNGTTMTLSFKEFKSKSNISVMGGMMNMDMIADAKDKKGLMLMAIPMMGKNVAVEMNADEMNQNQDNSVKPEITYDKRSKKKIEGFLCYKATVKTSLSGEPLIFYLTDKIKPNASSQIQNQVPGLNGFPLAFEINQMGLKLMMEAVKIDKSLPSDDQFEMKIPDGFEKITMDEFKQMGGGLGSFGL